MCMLIVVGLNRWRHSSGVNGAAIRPVRGLVGLELDTGLATAWNLGSYSYNNTLGFIYSSYTWCRYVTVQK